MPDDQNDQQAAALVAALTPALLDALLPKLQEHTEKQISGLAKNSQALLDELKQTRQNDAAREQSLRARMSGQTAPAVEISKSDARNVSKYRAAKELARSQGAELKITRD